MNKRATQEMRERAAPAAAVQAGLVVLVVRHRAVRRSNGWQSTPSFASQPLAGRHDRRAAPLCSFLPAPLPHV